MRHHPRDTGTLARVSEFDVEWVPEVEYQAVKGQRTDARKPPARSPGVQQVVRRGRQRPPSLPNMNQHAGVAVDANGLVIVADSQKLARTHQSVVSREKSTTNIHISTLATG